MHNVWVIQVTYHNGNRIKVNFNEGYKNYYKAKKAVLDKINPDYLKIKDDYTYFDLDKNIEYELKCVSIYD